MKRILPLRGFSALVLALLAAGCDPIVNIYGSFFPAWAICLVAGILFTVLLRLIFAATGLEQHMGPLVLIYPSLAFLLACLTWLVLYRG